MKKSFLAIVALLFFGISKSQRPNIVLIVSDDHAYQAISAYGNQQIRTPNIDRIAKEGVLFNKAYVTNSICGPSRAVILTGKYSHKNGFKDNEHSSFDGSQNTFIKELTKAGYQTAWIGKWHLETTPQGFTYWQVFPGQGRYYNPDFLMMDGSKKRVEGYAANVVEDESEKWLNNRDKSKPFCLVIGQKNTHRTWLPDTCDFGIYDHINFPLPHNFYDNYSGRDAAKVQDMTISNTMQLGYDLKMYDTVITLAAFTQMNPAQRARFDAYYKQVYDDFKKQNLSGNALTEWKYQRYIKDYLATAASLDRNIGRTLDYLDKHNLAKNTIVIYMSDQGFYMGEHGWFDKRFMYEESFRTPMVMRYPGHIKPGSIDSNLVMNLDIGPSLLQAAGVPIPNDMQGKSFLSLVENKKSAGRKAMYYHYYENGEHAVSPHFGISTGRYKLIRFYKRVNSWELYDMKTDKQEMNNLYGNKKYKRIQSRMKRELLKLTAQYDDREARDMIVNDKLKN